MVRTILDNQRLRENRSLQFAVLAVGICLVLASGPLWAGIADQDYRFSSAGERENLPIAVETSAQPYEQLPPTKQHLVDDAIAGESFRFEDATKQLPRFVSKGNTYYEFNSAPTVDWSDPTSLVPIVMAVCGVWFVLEAIQHRRKQLGPYGY